MGCASCGFESDSPSAVCPRCGATQSGQLSASSRSLRYDEGLPELEEVLEAQLEGLCRRCAAELADAEEGCPVCGTGGEGRCPTCGAFLDRAEAFCSNCFSRVDGRAAPVAEEVAEAPEEVVASLEEIPPSGAVAPPGEGVTVFEPLRPCPLCGYENPARAEFCGACWGRVGAGAAELPTRLRMVVDEELAERWEVHGVKTGFVGRARELAILSQLFEETVARRLPQLVTVVGEPGSGKSRLFAEYLTWLREHPSGARILAGVCREDEPAAALGPMARLLRERFELREQESAAEAQEKVRRAVAEVCAGASADEIAGLLLKFLALSPAAGPDDEEERAAPGTWRLWSGVARFLEADARAAPLVICLDDLHHASPEVLSALQHLVASVRGAPLLMLGLARPALFVRRPAWFEVTSAHYRLELGPLSPEESARLVQGILGQAGFGDAFVQKTCRRGGGNPLFLEELCRIALEEGPQAVGARPLPRSVAAAVQIRLQYLSPLARAVLEMAAVVGRTFWIGALVSLRRLEAAGMVAEPGDNQRYWFGADEAEEIRRALDELRARDFVTRNPQSSFPDEEEYLFKQGTERDLVAAEVAPERAALWHRFLSQWLLQRRGGNEEGRFARAARHRELAGDRPGAARLYLAAADRARSTGDVERAAEYYERGLGLLPDEEISTRLHVLHGLGDALTRAGEFDRALGRFREMLRCAWLLGERAKSGAAYNRIGRIYRHLGRYDAAMAALSDGHTLFLEARDWRGVAASLDDIGQVHRRRGDFEQALYHYQEALQLRREIGDPRGIALSLYNIGEIQRDAGRLAEAQPNLEEALRLIRGTNDRTGHAATLSALAALLQERGDVDRAEALWKEAVAIAREIGDRYAEGRILGRIGELARERGDLDRARELLGEALELVKAIEDRAHLSPILRALSETHLRAGDVERARDLCEEALRAAREIGSRLDEGVALRVLGEIHAQTLYDDARRDAAGPPPAESCLSQAVALFEELSNELELGRSLTALGNYLLERGQIDRGRELLFRAREILERREAARSLARAERTLGELS
jgi:tetratricopeptide (TPR) repeat protein/predicted amidophosphoribosyltransferase